MCGGAGANLSFLCLQMFSWCQDWSISWHCAGTSGSRHIKECLKKELHSFKSCSIKPEDVARVRSSELLAKLQPEDLDLIFEREKASLVWACVVFGWCIRTAYDMQLTASGGQGGPSKHGRN